MILHRGGASFDKMPWRRRNVAFYQSVRALWSNDILRVRLLEMAGDSITDSFSLFKGKVYDPAQLIGVDKDYKIVDKLRVAMSAAAPADRFRLVAGDAYRQAKALIAEPSPWPLAILVFDGTNTAGVQSWWDLYGALLADVVREVHRTAGLCALVLNHTLTHRPTPNDATPADERLRAHTAMITRCFRDWGMRQDAILPARLAPRAAPGDFLGQLGAYDIYKSEKRALRMATLRLLFHKGTVARYA